MNWIIGIALGAMIMSNAMWAFAREDRWLHITYVALGIAAAVAYVFGTL